MVILERKQNDFAKYLFPYFCTYIFYNTLSQYSFIRIVIETKKELYRLVMVDAGDIMYIGCVSVCEVCTVLSYCIVDCIGYLTLLVV